MMSLSKVDVLEIRDALSLEPLSSIWSRLLCPWAAAGVLTVVCPGSFMECPTCAMFDCTVLKGRYAIFFRVRHFTYVMVHLVITRDTTVTYGNLVQCGQGRVGFWGYHIP